VKILVLFLWEARFRRTKSSQFSDMDKNRQTGSWISPPDSFFSEATDRDCANHIRSLGRFDRGRGGGLQAALAI
jgi:hypothetical protein